MIKKELVENKNSFIALSIYIIALLFFCSKMSPLYPINEWADVNLYFNIGKGIFNGVTPYTEAFDHKGPLIFFIYGFGYLISNTSFFGMYIIECLAWIAMSFCIYLTCRPFCNKTLAFLSATLIPSMILASTLNGGSAEEFILVFEIISLYLFISYFGKETTVHNPKHMFIHGVLCTMTLFIKLNLVSFWFFPLLAIFVSLFIRKEYRNLVRNVLAFTLGFLIIAVPITLYFIANNALAEAWNIYVVLNKSYAQPGSIGEILERLFANFYQRIRFGNISFYIILAGALYFPIKYLKQRAGQIALILSFVALYVSIFISSYYIDYYYLPLYVYAIPGFIAISRFVTIPSTKLAYISIAVLCLYTGIMQRNLFGFEPGDLLNRKFTDDTISRFSDKIKKESAPTLLNLGLDNGNIVFTQTNIIPSVRYFITPNLSYEVYPQMRNSQTKYIEQKQVQFIILSQVSPNYEYFKQLSALNDNYEVIDTYVESGTIPYYLYKRKD